MDIHINDVERRKLYETCEFKYDYTKFYDSIRKMYNDQTEIDEQMSKDIPRLNVFVEVHNIQSHNKESQIRDKRHMYHYLNLFGRYYRQNLEFMTTLISQSVFGFCFYVIMNLYSDIENNVYIIDHIESVKIIKVKFETDRIGFFILGKFEMCSINEHGHKENNKTIDYILTFEYKRKDKQIHVPNEIHLKWTF